MLVTNLRPKLPTDFRNISFLLNDRPNSRLQIIPLLIENRPSYVEQDGPGSAHARKPYHVYFTVYVTTCSPSLSTFTGK